MRNGPFLGIVLAGLFLYLDSPYKTVAEKEE